MRQKTFNETFSPIKKITFFLVKNLISKDLPTYENKPNFFIIYLL